MPGRKFAATSLYRYGFNGKENDNEVKGEGNQQDYGMRIYDTRLGKFLSVDPIAKDYPELTPYQFASNRPIDGIDLDGLEYASHMDKYEYKGNGWDYLKAIPNAAGNIYNGLIADTWNSGVNTVKHIANGTYIKSLSNDASQAGSYLKQTGIKTWNYTFQTPLGQQFIDAGKTAMNPQTLETGVTIFIGSKIPFPSSSSKGNLLKPTSSNTEPTITLYRGVNENNVHYPDALNGIVKPNGGVATAMEHNTVSTLNSPFTSWTTNPEVAINFALRPGGEGVVLKTKVNVNDIIKSPNTKNVQLLQKPTSIVSESEVLLKKPVSNANVQSVQNNTFSINKILYNK